MFDFADKALVWIPVRWDTLRPGEDPDDLAVVRENEIEVQVEIVDRDRLREIFPGGVIDDKDAEASAFKALAHNWRKIRDGDKPVIFNDENVARLLAVPMFAGGFERAYMDAWSGRVEYREKNSEGSPSNGRADAEQGGTSKPKGARRRR